MADPTKLARRWLDPGPQAGMPAAVDASAIEDADALPRFQTHLGNVAQIVELRPDPGHGPVGDDHTDAGPRLTGRGTGDGVEVRLVIDIGGPDPTEAPLDRTNGTPSGGVDRPHLERPPEREPLGGVEVVAGPGPQIGPINADLGRHREPSLALWHRPIRRIGAAQHRHLDRLRRGLPANLRPRRQQPGGEGQQHPQRHRCPAQRPASGGEVRWGGHGAQRPRKNSALGRHCHGVSIHSLETRRFDGGNPHRRSIACRAESRRGFCQNASA